MLTPVARSYRPTTRRRWRPAPLGVRVSSRAGSWRQASARPPPPCLRVAEQPSADNGRICGRRRRLDGRPSRCAPRTSRCRTRAYGEPAGRAAGGLGRAPGPPSWEATDERAATCTKLALEPGAVDEDTRQDTRSQRPRKSPRGAAAWIANDHLFARTMRLPTRTNDTTVSWRWVVAGCQRCPVGARSAASRKVSLWSSSWQTSRTEDHAPPPARMRAAGSG
jgi:hypothetical protein